MDITESKINSATVLALSGRLDGLTSPVLEKRVEALLAAGTRQLVFDCGQLAYASSIGLRVFLGSAKKLKAVGGKVAFAALTPAVHEVFELSGFTGLFTLEPTAAAAAAAIA
jgi:anti-sigma B factor antagonist